MRNVNLHIKSNYTTTLNKTLIYIHLSQLSFPLITQKNKNHFFKFTFLSTKFMMTMKRSRDGDAEDISVMANYLMLLSSVARTSSGDRGTIGGALSRVFSCKTCNRQFPSFQALGGHRASHKKPRLADQQPPSPAKPKTHECSICGLEFPLGQALGGHMRRHRATVVDRNHHHHQPAVAALPLFPVVKKPNNRRVFSLDLNLTPLENKFFLVASSQI